MLSFSSCLFKHTPVLNVFIALHFLIVFTFRHVLHYLQSSEMYVCSLCAYLHVPYVSTFVCIFFVFRRSLSSIVIVHCHHHTSSVCHDQHSSSPVRPSVCPPVHKTTTTDIIIYYAYVAYDAFSNSAYDAYYAHYYSYYYAPYYMPMMLIMPIISCLVLAYYYYAYDAYDSYVYAYYSATYSYAYDAYYAFITGILGII